ncbi:MAG: alcohol dehydrogenase catalytic domain-containing protein [Actinomycetaceae bacterium]|nr:alcohol dehydrogenase catalytic domain-containing protein [Actinomycetaceae bacterium]
MSICQADQRYYQGRRPKDILEQKFPMALIHEAVGVVVRDDSGTFALGTPVAMVPNIPGDPVKGVYENYADGFLFLSSGADGFMREIVDLPIEQVVEIPEVSVVTAQSEMTSVACHAVDRWQALADGTSKRVAIWGDGSVGYILAAVLRELYPDLYIAVIGTHHEKLDFFTMANDTFIASKLPADFSIDDAFECVGGAGSVSAVAEIIQVIRPQGNVILMGVTENPIAVETRMVLEKGLTLVGSSRSGRDDFVCAAKLWESPKFRSRIRRIVYEEEPVRTVDDIHRVFMNDLGTTFKTAFKWEL